MIKIEYLEEEIPVYDITVTDNHNFFANGILVHNCAEILEVVTGVEDVDPVTGIVGQTAVCNLASVCLPKYVKVSGKKKKFDFQKLEDVVYQVTLNLNKVIDINYYPSDRGMRSNQSTRPIATGVQGLADVYMMMGLPFESAEARVLNREIFETMYYAALRASNDLAKEHGSYDFFKGSPASQGILQFDMWNVKPSDRYDWEALRASIVQFGLRNSLTLALMPTASCFSSDNTIITSDGTKSYKEIMNEQDIDWKRYESTDEQGWVEFKEPIQVKTRFGFKESNKIFYNGHKPTIKLEMEDGTIFECTENHKFLVNRNEEMVWVEAKDLEENDDIVTK